MTKTLVVNGRLKELSRTKEGKALNISKDLSEALTLKVEKIIEEACNRAVLNNRTTVMPKDI